jgi:hypothetical protein
MRIPNSAFFNRVFSVNCVMGAGSAADAVPSRVPGPSLQRWRGELTYDCFTVVTRSQFLDLLLKILPSELLPHEEESYSPYDQQVKL